MAYSEDNQTPVSVDNKDIHRNSADLLPLYFRTEANKKFLGATLDSLISKGNLERLNGYVGSRYSKNSKPSDIYVQEPTDNRRRYNFLPSAVIRDDFSDKTEWVGTYDDLLNQINYFNGDTTNHSRLTSSDYYVWNPLIDFDKFVNYRQYYWLPNGPSPVTVTGNSEGTSSTYQVTNSGNEAWVFTPNGFSKNPIVTLYRGATYVFDVNALGHPFYLKVSKELGAVDQYNEGVQNNGAEVGVVTFTVPSSAPDKLFYVCGRHQSMQGFFEIKNAEEELSVNINTEILDKKEYTSANGVKFTNGLKVNFEGEVTPATYKNKNFYVEGVGNKIKLIPEDQLQTPEIYSSNFDYEFDVEEYDDTPFDDVSNYPTKQEYITINRSSQDKNPWSRYNRWIHKDVIEASATYNNTTIVLDENQRAKRPIIEFNPNIKLYNFGSVGKDYIDVIDTQTTDVMSDVEGSLGYYVDEVILKKGMRVIFNADPDITVKGKIYEVDFVEFEGKNRIHLNEVYVPITDDTVVIIDGESNQGTSWFYNDGAWIKGQQKTSLNQAPKFELFDKAGNSFADETYYSGTTFTGNELVSYKVGTGNNDVILGFPISYQNVNNVGDIVFEFDWDDNTFNYTDNTTIKAVDTASGYVKIFSNETTSRYESGWQKTKQRTRQGIIQLNDIIQETDTLNIVCIDNPHLYLNDMEITVEFNDVVHKPVSDFNIIVNEVTNNVSLVFASKTIPANTRTVLKVHTKQKPNANGFYEPPLNLTNNAENNDLTTFTLGSISDHFKTIFENNINISGVTFGPNNSRDLIDIHKSGLRYVKHGGSLLNSIFSLVDYDTNIIKAIRKQSKDYNLFKEQFLVKGLGINLSGDISTDVDDILYALSLDRKTSSPYYYSDMAGFGKKLSVREYTKTAPTQQTFGLDSSFDITSLQNRSVYVYVNGVQLYHDQDYVFDAVDNGVTIKKAIAVGDKVTIKDYNTVGNVIPQTPTKLGLYPKFKPEIYLDTSYVTPREMLRGHDGSITATYGDIRDDLLLEFEKRIYNNIKVSYNRDVFDINEYTPGAFRETDYSLEEFNRIMRNDFGSWASLYGVDITTNDVTDVDNLFTLNYNSIRDTFSQEYLPGYWKGIYSKFYGTWRPDVAPWECLGFSEKPTWWEDEYGPAPYTNGNKKLWSDLELGRIRYTSGEQINSVYARPGLSKIIPVNEYGELLDPVRVGIVGEINESTLRKDFVFGDHHPAEISWRTSSWYPFALQIALALTKPAQYHGSLFDTGQNEIAPSGSLLYKATGKILDLTDARIHTLTYDNTKHIGLGYHVFVVEYLKSLDKPIDSSYYLKISKTSMNLVYKLGGFAAKNRLRVLLESSNPDSKETSIFLPSENYELKFRTSNPVKSAKLSGIVVEKTDRGYLVRGYDNLQPFFTVYGPIHQKDDPVINVGGTSAKYVLWTQEKFYGVGQIVEAGGRYYRCKEQHTSTTEFDQTKFTSLPSLPLTGGAEVQKATRWKPTPKIIAYGSTYLKIQDVYDIILGYGKWLESEGFVFDKYLPELLEIQNWEFSGKEFLFWTTQGWSSESVIALAPFADGIKFSFSAGQVDNVLNSFYDYTILTASGSVLPRDNFSTTRQDGVFTIRPRDTNNGIYFIQLNLVQKEHVIVFDDKSQFGDILYDQEAGYRAKRIKLLGFKTSEWNGDYYSPGFIYDEAQITDWYQFKDYYLGEVVRYKNIYYSAKKFIPGTETFDINDWLYLGTKPVAELLPNLDYKASSFEDFYSLESENFDVDQTKFAQHLIGYQKRTYLDNLIQDETSQYKFYQGFIKEKGTKNSIEKIQRLRLEGVDTNIDIDEEWAFKVGSLGSNSTVKEIEFALDEKLNVDNPQGYDFVSQRNAEVTSSNIIKLLPKDIAVKPSDYNTTPWPLYDRSTSENTIDYIQKLPVAGTPRLDDVTITLFNYDDILGNAVVNALKEGDTIWLAKNKRKDWDVLRLTGLRSRLIQTENKDPSIDNDGVVTLYTDLPHGLSQGTIISIKDFDPLIDNVYEVNSVLSSDTFTIQTDLDTLPLQSDSSTGSLLEFVSIRLQNIDDLNDLKEVTEFAVGSKIFADNDSNGDWGVYEKSTAFVRNKFGCVNTTPDQAFGQSIVSGDAGRLIVVGAPDSGDEGTVYVLRRKFNTNISTLGGVQGFALSANPLDNLIDGRPKFGWSLALSSTDTHLVAGAPFASNFKSTSTPSKPKFFYGNINSTPQGSIKSGVVKVSKYNTLTNLFETEYVIGSPDPQSNAEFGYSVAISDTRMLVGAPGQTNDQGNVFVYEKVDNDWRVATNYKIGFSNARSGDRFGEVIASSSDLSTIAVNSAGYETVEDSTYDKREGAVHLYTYNNTTSTYDLLQSITSSTLGVGIATGDQFGTSISLNADGTVLVVGSPYSDVKTNNNGAVYYFKKVNNTFVLEQVILSPEKLLGERFGSNISLNPEGDSFVVYAEGGRNETETVFDLYITPNNPSSGENEFATTFDANTTKIKDFTQATGTVYSYTKLGTKFVFGQKLVSYDITTNDGFGQGLDYSTNSVFIGAPQGNVDSGEQTGTLYVYQKEKTAGWNLLRQEKEFTNPYKIKSAFTYDTTKSEVKDYLEIIDPAKGKIPYLAEAELSYKSNVDPAIYSVSDQNVNVNENKPWTDEHVGELWWDLDTVRYVYYEQGDTEFRTNNWGTLFPGSSIDVYEWVESDLLPEQWNEIADTNEGVAIGFSGQSKYDNNTVAFKRVYSATTNTFQTRYYYWVRNTVIVPDDATTRNIPAIEVANIIANPIAYGIKSLQILSKNSISLSNIKTTLADKNISVAIYYSNVETDLPEHNEWLLLRKNQTAKIDHTLLIKKLYDSLVGFDNQGNAVPDPDLPSQRKYGLQIRPRQSMFKDRLQALKLILTFVNDTMSNSRIVDTKDISKLRQNDPQPTAISGKYDIKIDNFSDISLIGTQDLLQCKLTPILKNGRLSSVQIDNAGFGYKIAPEIIVQGDGVGARAQSTIDSNGRVTSVEVLKTGKNYTSCSMQVRPFKVLVDVDETANNYWTMYEWNTGTNLWVRTNTQTYDLSRFWSYADFILPTFDLDFVINYKISAPYQLDTIEPTVGDYVRIENAGDGNVMILQRVESDGSYNNEYNLVYKQNSTIKFNENLYDYARLNFGFAGAENFDINLFDEQPITETRLILEVIQNNIFVDELRSKWNDLFFIAIKYALSEQLFVDWVFKTSFVNIKNKLGGFSRKLNYNLNDPAYIEEYIKEVKPYRSSIREFITSYDTLEESNIGNTDFDLPSYYNPVTKKFEVLDTNSIKISEQPYVNWFDNYQYSVGEIRISNKGEGYRQNPLVVITGGREVKPDLLQTRPFLTLVDKDYDATHFYIKTNNIPNHNFDAENLVRQNFIFKITRTPVEATTKVSTQLGAIAIATNGVVMFNPKALEKENRNGVAYQINAVASHQELGIDDGSGHSQAEGVYHYHSDPRLMYEKDKTTHSPIIGYSLDGYPIYGPYGYENVNGPSAIKVITSSYRLKTTPRADGSIPNGRYIEDFEYVAGLGDLDEHNGRYTVTPEYPNGTYAYFVTVNPNNVDEAVYPYIIGPSYYGVPLLPNGNYTLPTGIQEDAIAEAYIARGQLREIKLIKEGSGYTTAPIVSIVGGGGSDTITEVAKAVPILKNKKVRINTINMKFDRLSSQKVIQTQTAVDTFTATAGQVKFKLTYVPTLDKRRFTINVNNETAYIESYNISIATKENATYKAQEGYIIFNTPPGEGAVVTITYQKSIALMQATDRIDYYYEPTAGMPGKDPAQLMTGVEYDGVNIQGLEFGVSVGWDGLPWFSHGWDTFSGSNIDYAFRADGNTNTFTLPYTPELNQNINVYFDGVRQDPTNTPTIVGDGTLATYTLNVTPADGVLVVFRPDTSDGSLAPTDVNNLDTLLSGGTFAVTNGAFNTAIGQNPEDIEIDGDGFVTPDTSHAPEEVVPGQVFDTISMKIYNAPADGSPIIKTNRYFASGTTNEFAFEQLPGTEASIFVTVDGTYLKDSEYTINWKDKKVSLSSTPAVDNMVTVQTLNISGSKILERATFTGDGSTTEFLLTAKYDDVKSAFVTVNGVSKNYVLRKANNGSVIVDISYTAASGDAIQIVVMTSVEKTYSEIKKEQFTYNGSTEYTLSEQPANIAPLHSMVIVEVTDQNTNVTRRLRAPDTVYYVSNGITLDYPVSQNPAYPTFSLALGELEVYQNGTRLTAIADYQFDTTTNLLTFYQGNLQAGDVIAITILRNHQYEISLQNLADSSRASYLNLDVPSPSVINNGDIISVTTFTNHDTNLIRKEVFEGNVGGTYTLSRKAVDTNYVWVELDGKPLVADIDYKVLDDRQTFYIDDKFEQLQTSRVVAMTFSEEISYDAVGYHIFKDMINRVHFKRISAQDRTTLSQALNKNDKEINLVDASFLPEPSKQRKIPGVIFIDRERIEYYEKSGNTLKQITRGTLGTGVKDDYPVGTSVEDASVNQTMPYTDTTNVYESIIRPGLPNGRSVHVLETINVASGVEAHDQVEVYLGGRKLQKPTPSTNLIKKHNIEIAYDSEETNSLGVSSDVVQTPEFTIEPVGDSTGKGYYKLVLRDEPQDGLELKVVQKQGRIWYEQGLGTASNGATLQRAETKEAKFLLERTSGLPVINIKE